MQNFIFRWFARGRGPGSAGLHLWISGGGWKLPDGACTKVCIGVNSLTVSSPQSPKLWQAPLDPLISPSSSPFSDQWHSISLPGNTVGENNSIQQVASGLSHTIILSSSGRVFSIGKGYFGQTGEWAHEDGGLLGEVMTGLKEGFVKQVACGLDHSLFLMNNGVVFACGWAADGQTGTGLYENSSRLVGVELGSNKVAYIATCSDSSFAVTDQGEVFAWGNNEYRQLGVCSEAPQLCLPEAIDCSALDGVVTAIAAGGGFTAFLTCQGSVYLAGYNIDTVRKTPVPAHGLLRQIHNGKIDGKVVKLRAGLNYMLVWTSSNSGLIWGKLHLQNHQESVHCRTKFMVGPDVFDLACGPLHLAAITGSSNSEVLKLTGM